MAAWQAFYLLILPRPTISMLNAGSAASRLVVALEHRLREVRVRVHPRHVVEVVEAFEKLARVYPTSVNVPDSLFLKGQALQSLKHPDRAREAWESVMKTYPDSAAASLAKQRLGR